MPYVRGADRPLSGISKDGCVSVAEFHDRPVSGDLITN